jgi:hypothetical protein
MMEKLISCCGLNCATCEARIATLANDDELRKATAEKWKVMFNVPDLDYQLINCTGCREEGVKLSHCYECEIRKCAMAKGLETCGQCSDLGECKIVASVHKFAPEALDNLRSLN